MIKIIWTDRAKTDYWDNIDYLEHRWGLYVTINFMNEVDSLVNILSKENTTFKPTKYENVFQALVVEQITLYYKKNEKSIELLRFWNNYQNPEKLNLSQ